VVFDPEVGELEDASGNKDPQNFNHQENLMNAKNLITLALVSTLGLGITTTAEANAGADLASVMVYPDYVRVEFSSRVRCPILLDEDGFKATSFRRAFCEPGLDVVSEIETDELIVAPGEYVQLCNTENWECTDLVMVREAGDLNGDAAINVIDLIILHRTVMGKRPAWWPTSWEDRLAADINEDGELNVLDLVLLVDLMDLD